jgi:hypothetical protein
MSEEARFIARLNFDPDDPSLPCEEGLRLPVRLQSGTTAPATPHPGNPFPGPDPPDPGDAIRHPGEGLSHRRAGHRRRGRQKLTPLDFDLQIVDPTRDRVVR